MSTDERHYKRTWWAISLVVIAIAELIVCLLLFIPQSEVLANARRQQALVDQQVAEIEQAPRVVREIEGQIAQTENTLTQLNLFSKDAPEQALIAAVSRALAATGVELSEFRPDRKTARTESVPADLWQLRCHGSFGQLMSLLVEVQKQNIVVRSDGFSLAAADGRIDLTASLGVWTEKALRTATAAGVER